MNTIFWPFFWLSSHCVKIAFDHVVTDIVWNSTQPLQTLFQVPLYGTKGGLFLYFCVCPVTTIKASYCSVLLVDLCWVRSYKGYEKHELNIDHEIVWIIKIGISAFVNLFLFLNRIGCNTLSVAKWEFRNYISCYLWPYTKNAVSFLFYTSFIFGEKQNNASIMHDFKKF